MTAASRPLLDLEQIDSRIDAERIALGSLEERLRGNSDVARVEKTAVALATDLRRAQAKVRTLERQVEDAANSIKKLNETLYGGRIHDAREMRSMEAEIQHAGVRRSTLEDEEIALLERIEILERQAKEAQERFEGLARAWERDRPVLENRREAHVGTIANLQEQREAAARTVDPARLDMYSRLRARHGHAVSVVRGTMCQWCRVQLPSADIQHARGDSIITCTNCCRILYAE